MFPAAIFHSVLLNFHRNDGVFVTICLAFCVLKIAKRKPKSANAIPCFFSIHWTRNTFHSAVTRSALPASLSNSDTRRVSKRSSAKTCWQIILFKIDDSASNASSWWRHAATSHRLRQLSRCSLTVQCKSIWRKTCEKWCAAFLVRMMFCVTFSFGQFSFYFSLASQNTIPNCITITVYDEYIVIRFPFSFFFHSTC